MTSADAVRVRAGISRLREQAEAATSGPWKWDSYSDRHDLIGRGGSATYAYDQDVLLAEHNGECGCRSACHLEVTITPADRAHIARWSPQVVLALCDDWTRRLDRDEATLTEHYRIREYRNTPYWCEKHPMAVSWPCPDARQASESVADLARLIDTIEGTGP